jgi:hypothetical protein
LRPANCTSFACVAFFRDLAQLSIRRLMQLLLRFLIGGAVVSLFALAGDAVRPKSFAGIFGAAPSIALATLALTIHVDGPSYASTEARSMIVGALALMVYAWAASRAMWKSSVPVPVITLVGLLLWMGVAATGWLAFLRQMP